MACCILTAYMMNKIIQSLELFDIKLISIKYNDFDDEPAVAAFENSSTITTFAVDGMTCGTCTNAIRAAITKLSGVNSVNISLPLGQATVLHDASTSPVSNIVEAINAAGYDATPDRRTPEKTVEHLERNEELTRVRSSVTNATALASSIAIVNTVAQVTGQQRGLVYLSTMVGSWVILHDAAYIHKSACRSLKARRLTMETLTSLSLLLSVVMAMLNYRLFGIERARMFTSSGAYLAMVILCGRYIDLMLRRKSGANFSALYRLQADTAKVQIGTTKAEMPAVLLQPQDEIVLEPQTMIPVDCYVLQGCSSIDQSVMTGESRPVYKTTGDLLLAGTRNLSGRLTAVVTKSQKDSSLQSLVDGITSSLEATTDTDSLSSRLLSYFVGFVLLLAAAGFQKEYAYRKHDPGFLLPVNKACERAMAVLASACPCALGLATPTAIMAGIDVAWKRGVLITDAVRVLDKMTCLTHVVMDKTGTLTEGKLRVTNLRQESEMSSQDVCLVLCAVQRSAIQAHPVASAIFSYALNALDHDWRLEQNKVEVRNHNILVGSGVACDVRVSSSSKWRHVVCGSALLTGKYLGDRVFEQAGITESTEAFLVVDEVLVAHITLQDTIREEAAAVIKGLKNHGLQVSMLTGDVDDEARRVCSKLHVPLLAARSMNKKQHIQDLQRDRHVVAMVGDGVNDLPAQSQADVGIHLKQPNSVSAAASAAQMLILSPDLRQLLAMLKIARMTMRQSRINLVWAVVYNLVAVSLAMGIGEAWGLYVDAAMAGTMMAMSSITVMAMSLHLRHRLGQIPADGV